MERSILDRVSVKLTDEDFKRIIKLALLKDDKSFGLLGGTLPDTYSALKHLVNDEDVKECVKYRDFILNFFKQYVNRLFSIDITKLADEELKQDIETVRNSSILQNPGSVQKLFNNEEFKKLNFHSIFPQELDANSRFIHVRGSYLHGFLSEDVQCRLYLSPKMENIAELSSEMVSRHNAKNLPCYFKFCINGNDNDRIVLYSEVANADKHLQVLDEIRKEKPYLFEGMNKNPLWADIDNVADVYFGMEPYGSKTSYGAIRGAIFDEAIYDLRGVYDDFDINQDITAEMVDKFKRFFHIHCLAHNVNSNNLALNMNNEVGEEQINPLMLRTKKGREMPIWVHYINPQTMTASISSSVLTADGGLDITLDELEMLYQYKQDNPNYTKSEMVRTSICERIQNLQRKQRIDKALDIVNPVTKYRNKMIVQRSFDGRAFVGGGLINYNLYRLLPYKVSELLGKLQLRIENRKNSMVDVALTEDIAILNESISGGNAREVQATIQTVIAQTVLTQQDELRRMEDVPIPDSSNLVVEEAPRKK